MEKYFSLRGAGALPAAVATLAVAFFVVTIAHAATTISTNIQTDGTLSVTGTGTFLGSVDITGSATSSPVLTLRDPLGNDSLELRAGTSTLENTFVGFGAGHSNTTGVQNTVNGYDALYDNTTGTGNTANGYAALYNDTTGNDNTATGLDALDFNSTGSYNTADGFSALVFDSGSSNAAVGFEAANGGTLYQNQGGTYLGSESGVDAGNNSDFNTFVGYRSGYNVTTGFDNILIGANPDYGGDHLTTGANDICIGFNCILPGGTSATNQLSIGNIIFGTGLTATSSSTSIPGTLTGNIGIGTSSPVANFQVANDSATTTMELGSSGQSKGSCLKLYRTDGTAIYAYVAAGATTFTLTTTACATVTNF